MNMCITWISINSVTKAIISLFCPSIRLFVHLCVRFGVSVCLYFSQSAYMSGYQLSVFAFFVQLSVCSSIFHSIWFSSSSSDSKQSVSLKIIFDLRFVHTFRLPFYLWIPQQVPPSVCWKRIRPPPPPHTHTHKKKKKKKIKYEMKWNLKKAFVCHTPQWMIKVDIVSSICWIDSNYF